MTIVAGRLEGVHPPAESDGVTATRSSDPRIATGERAHGELVEALADAREALAQARAEAARHAADAERARSELRLVTASLAEAVLVVDPDGRLAMVNPPALALLGFGPDERVPSTITEIDARVRVEEDGARTSLAEIARCAADGGEGRDVALQLRVDGSEWTRTTKVHAVAFPGGRGEPRRALLVAVDGSELRRLEREKDDFLSLAAHELRTPLTPMTMLLQTLERKARAGVVDLDAIVRTRRQVVRLTRLISDLLDFSRVHDETLELHPEPLELGQLVSQVVDTFRSTAQKHTVEIELSDAPYFVRGDKSRLEQVLVNLLDNAVKYSPGGGTVRVVAERRGLEVAVSVEDQGIGIPRDQQGRLFERFFRADNASNRKFQGFGLGLYLAHAIVERHLGSMSVTSDIGRGSRFTFVLPLVESQSLRDRPKTAPRVLLIDDDPDILHVAGDILEDEGYEVLRAHDGAEALRHIETQAPDLVLLDLMMPVTDGWDVLGKLRGEGRRCDVPVIVLSAHDSLAEQATRLHADAWLGKPFEVDALVRKVAEFIGAPPSSDAP